MLSFFFFKQKTAYEMRISDWSSDVCSSDLFGRFLATLLRLCPKRQREVDRIEQTSGLQIGQTRQIAAALQSEMGQKALGGRIKQRPPRHFAPSRRAHPSGLHQHIERALGYGDAPDFRSEEHTSELQSLMRLSYAVFCLNNIKQNKNNYHI